MLLGTTPTSFIYVTINNMKPLPIGIQTFRKIVEGNYLYIDKTEYIYQLIRDPYGLYFLARPRRFGKSLLISTLAEIFAGNRTLFQSLWLYNSAYTWQTYPVIRLDFSQESIQSAAQLEYLLIEYLQEIAGSYNITLEDKPYQTQFRHLVRQLAAQNKVVILIDEYDKPILDNINNIEEAKKIRDVLKGFYTTIKSLDAYIRFVFLTGISKFSKVGVFSGLNNLQDLTLNWHYAAMLGLTQEEVEQYFDDRLETFAATTNLNKPTLLAKIKHWYNGFCFSAQCEPVYNPFSLLLLFNTHQFQNFWFESGTPTFLLKLIKSQQYDPRQIERLILTELGFSSYEIEDLDIIALLFQTGYLTIVNYEAKTRLYTLYYPNYEVERAFLYYLLGTFGSVPTGMTGGHLWDLIHALQVGDMVQFFETLNIFFANIPYDIHLKQEKYYQTIFYLIFKLIGLEITAEARTNWGRIDAVVELDDTIFLFEFKLDQSAAVALRQIQDKAYYQRYLNQNKPLTLIGVNFSPESRQVTDWQVGKPNEGGL